jgi:hypothetical protein
VVVEKYLAAHALDLPARDGLEREPAEPEPGPEPERAVDRRIGPATRLIRALAGAGCLAVATLMYLNGSVLRSFPPYAIAVFFTAAGLYAILSYGSAIKVRQFAWEMVVLVFASLGLRLGFPEYVSMDSQPLESPTLHALPAGEEFLSECSAWADAAESVVQSAESKVPADPFRVAVAVSLVPLAARYDKLDRPQKMSVYLAWTAIMSASAAMREGLSFARADAPPVLAPGAADRVRVAIARFREEAGMER